MRNVMRWVAALAVCWGMQLHGRAEGVLKPADYRHYVENFNKMEPEGIVNAIPNAQAWDWMVANVPFFDCPAKRFEEVYYFRWWSYRKHIAKTAKNYPGYIITEFITKPEPVSCSYGQHLAEGRWLKDQEYLDQDTLFWFRGNNGKPAEKFHRYSSWAIDALYQRYLVTGDKKFLVGLLDDFVADYQKWEAEKLRPDGLFWQYDVWDGMEESISGGRKAQNVRPTINSYMAANARALAEIARLAGKPDVAAMYEQKYATLRQKMNAALWDAKDNFYKVQYTSGGLSQTREELGFIPWMFGLAGPEHAVAWKQLSDPQGFWAPWGITTAEQRSPYFRTHGVGTCEWDGAVWPFATCQTLTGLANLLTGPDAAAAAPFVSKWDYFNALLIYAQSHQMDAQVYIGEYLDEMTGAWLKGRDSKRSMYYNHSTFCDLVIAGLVGLKPRADDVVEVAPLLPNDSWNWFCLDRVPYHGRELTVVWDRDGKHYGRKAGLSVYCDDKLIATTGSLGRISGKL